MFKSSALVLLIILVSCQPAPRPVQSSFQFEHQLTLPGDPAEIYDAISGDISGWWDHSFSDNPYKLYIEAKPGGGFYEIFDKSGDGALHATVILAQRGKILRFEGPLGLSGRAINLVCTYNFQDAEGDSTILKLEVSMSGEADESVCETVKQVWHHFLFDRFQPYIENGKTPLQK